MEFSRTMATIAAIGSDQNGENPSSNGAVVIRQTSKPRNRLVTSPGGNAPAWLATMGAPKSTPLAWVQRTAASSPAAAVAVAMKAASAPSVDGPVAEAQIGRGRETAQMPPIPRGPRSTPF